MHSRFFTLLVLFGISHLATAAEPEFPLTEDSKPHAEVPKGEMVKGTYTAAEKSVFPGTEREYQIYVPNGLDRTQPAAYMVFQDGVIYQAPVVFDNLVAKKDIPPLIGIFIKPGVVPAASERALPRYNRSYEYDSVTDSYAQFLIDEFLPALEAKHQLKLSSDPNDSAISGNSSGGIAAFMVAWHRPDRFRRIFTGVGTYVGIHGADQLPVLVRKTEPKPLRVFLQSGTADNNIYCGDWWMANQMMERSLAWAGYEVDHAWGEGGHNQKHASQVFPDAMRWLWKDWPTSKEIKANAKAESKWKGYEIIEPGSAWTPLVGIDVAPGTLKALTIATDPENQVRPGSTPHARTQLFGGKAIPALPKSDFPDGAPYSTTLSPDQSLLYVARPDDAWVQSYQITPDGTLRHPQPFFLLQGSDAGKTVGAINAGGMCVDTEGRLYIATASGIQVCDQAGRVNFIIPTPKPPHDICFGGKDLSTLYIACGDVIYMRPTKAHGVVSGQSAPIKPAAPKL